MRLFKRKIQKKGKKNKASQCSPNRAVLEPLEPRLLLDAMTYAVETGAAMDATLRLQKVNEVDTVLLVQNDINQSVLISQALGDFSGTDAVVKSPRLRGTRCGVKLTTTAVPASADSSCSISGVWRWLARA